MAPAGIQQGHLSTPHLNTQWREGGQLLFICFQSKFIWKSEQVAITSQVYYNHLDIQPKQQGFLIWYPKINLSRNPQIPNFVQTVQIRFAFLFPFFRQTPNKMQVKAMKDNWKLI